MAEAALLAVDIDALASGTVSGGGSDVDRTSDHTLAYGAGGMIAVQGCSSHMLAALSELQLMG